MRYTKSGGATASKSEMMVGEFEVFNSDYPVEILAILSFSHMVKISFYEQ